MTEVVFHRDWYAPNGAYYKKDPSTPQYVPDRWATKKYLPSTAQVYDGTNTRPASAVPPMANVRVQGFEQVTEESLRTKEAEEAPAEATEAEAPAEAEPEAEVPAGKVTRPRRGTPK